ncbi:gliding motility protein GldL [Puteibacter caeruleilacunae]|nr:gliding motility protein GldL [Puteibacter caeruleilacunae]
MNIAEMMISKRWKTFMGYVYGWGAAVVMIGALFKLQHWPYSGYFLTSGLCAEALIFFLSAFEPPVEIPDWSKVYPELREDSGLFDDEFEEETYSKKASLTDVLSGSDLTPELLGKLKDSLTNLTNTANGLKEVSNASFATDLYVKNINSASESIGTFAQINNRANESVNENIDKLIRSYSETANIVTTQGKDVASKLAESGSRIAGDLDQSGKLLKDSYDQLAKNLSTGMESVSKNTKDYDDGVANMNKNLSALNAAYELQLKNTKEQNDISGIHAKEMESLNKALSETLQHAMKYQQQAKTLNDNLEALNSIYGNMLGAMNHRS